ncbi:matrix-remodeling-associated protein 7-like [Anneissia japonica]|uniref:matrix-remodeling-associated protein 7-like n=1 Tax=Anneissia japonica TaxID=1529436 RepID=UPI001425A674|nr:matrix-remodeling-associated protein 7-like [Anneissia japonica]XP_033116963.1 matrix-remodeling-associated protein 7-like [Anneissia japonica]
MSKISEMHAEVEDDCMYYITASLVTLLAVLIVVRFSQRIMKSQKTEEQEIVHEQADKKSEDKEVDSDIDDVLIKPEEIEEISESSVVADDNSDEMKETDFRCESLQGKLKQARQRKMKEKLEGHMTEGQIDAESEAKKSQLEAIFQLMEQSKDTFGIDNMNDVQDQLKLYAL